MSYKVIDPRKKYNIVLNEIDIQVATEALGILHVKRQEQRENAKCVEIVLDKIYKAMGIDIDH